jgi:hypothetical protein
MRTLEAKGPPGKAGQEKHVGSGQIAGAIDTRKHGLRQASRCEYRVDKWLSVEFLRQRPVPAMRCRPTARKSYLALRKVGNSWILELVTPAPIGKALKTILARSPDQGLMYARAKADAERMQLPLKGAR